MAYRRRYAARARRTTRKRRTTTRSSRRYRSTKRVYRRRLSTKAILNKTSKKKRDTRVSFANTNGSGSPIAPGVGALVVNGGSGGFMLYCPTQMPLADIGGAQYNPADEAARTATTCYMRGYKETIRITTNSPYSWFWRRICFTARDDIFHTYQSAAPTNTTGPSAVLTSNGMVRLAMNQTVNGPGGSQFADFVTTRIFKGSQNVDWLDYITAPIDTRRVDLKFDKTYTISSGNQQGVTREFKHWYPMNKNLVYNDDEAGDNQFTSSVSVRDKRGMGDYLILDIIQSANGATSTDLLQFIPGGSLYWHEK